MQPKPNKNHKEESQISQVLGGYISYWPLFLICFVLALGAAYLYIRYTVPKYDASASIIIKDEKKGAEDSKGIESLDIINTKKIIDNEIEVLQSKIIIDSVVTHLRLYAPIFQEGKLRIQSAYVTSPVLVEAKHPEKIRSVEKILLKYDSLGGKVTLDNSFSGPINEWLKTPFGELRFVPNPHYYYYGIPGNKSFFFSLTHVGSATNNILGSLKVFSPSKTSSVVELNFRDEVPEKAEDILNEVINYYNKNAIAEKNSLVKNTLASILSRMDIVAGNLDSIQKKIQSYKAGNKAIEIETQGSLYLASIGNSDNELGKVGVQLEALDELKKFVVNNDNAGVLPSGVGINDPTLTQQMINLNTDQLEYERLKKTVGEGNPILTSLKERINKAKPNILSNIETQRKNLQLSRANLSSTSGRYNSMLTNLPEKERELLAISRDQNIQNNIYQFLLTKREETELSYTSTNSDSKVVNYAEAGNAPVSPKKQMIYLAALLFGLAMPILLINAREMMNSKVLYRKEIENLSSFPVIGEIVHNKSKNTLVLEPGKRSFIAEEFRKIRVSLLFLGIDSYHKKILVTSSIPGEGKSFIAANLALSLAMTGKKVVLIDLDLHNPSLGKLFNVSTDEPGVSDFLLGEKSASEIVRKLPAYDNLSFVSSGGLHPTPSELLENGEIQKLISYLEGAFDLVIIDTAPVVLVTDAYHLSSISDATLYVVRHKYTPKMVIRRIDENNKINSLKNPAIIFNGIKKRGYLKNNNGYGYDYIYGGNQKITKGNKLKA